MKATGQTLIFIRNNDREAINKNIGLNYLNY
jgi:hypothetical protein